MSSDRIRTPWNVRLRRFQHRLLPVFCFMITLGFAVWLWRFHAAMPEITGSVEAVRVNVSATEDGLLLPTAGRPLMLFDQVRSGDVLARLDPAAARAELDALMSDLAEIRGRLSTERVQLILERLERESDHRREVVRLTWQIENHRLDVLDRTTEIEVDKVERMRLASNLAFISAAFKQDLITEMEYEGARLLQEQAVKRIKESEKAKLQAEGTLADAERRLREFPDPIEPELETLIAPLRSAITAGEARVRAVEVRVDRLVIRAPITGTICAINAWPGQAVKSYEPIMVIAAEQGRYVVGYIRSYQRIEPRIGSPVRVRRHAGPIAWTRASIDRVGPQVEPIPLFLLRDPKTPEWGLAVRIPMPKTLRARPGERIDIVFGGSGRNAEAEVGPGNAMPDDRSSLDPTSQGG